MKNRHSIQIRALLEQKRLSRSRFNPQSVPYTSPNKNNRPMKRSQSSSTLRRKQAQLSDIETRYRMLQDSYRQIYEQTKAKAVLFQKQRQQLQKYKRQHERDQRQIDRLRTMVGFIKKTDQGIQTIQHNQFRDSPTSKRIQQRKKQKQHTPLLNKETFMNKTAHLISSPMITHVKKDTFNYGSLYKSRQPFEKFKFVPTLPLQ